jgi:hypothetical protein
MEMGKTISNQGVDVQGPIATLSPIFAIEANLPVYPQFSTGPFLFRVGDLLTAEQRKHFVGTSRATVAELLDSDPPAAILAGFEKELDGPLIEYAHVNRYRLADVAGLNGQLYIRPAAAASLRSVR